MKRKLDDLDEEDASTDSPINMLLNELLEEIFTYLTANDMLSCRLVCILWNDLICNDPRLLQRSVGIHLQITQRHLKTNIIPELELMQQNSALKLFKITLKPVLFLHKPAKYYEANLLMIEKFFANFNLDTVTQLQVNKQSKYYKAVDDVVFEVLQICKNVKKFVFCEVSWSVTDEKWKNYQWKSVEEIHFENKNGGYIEQYENLCDKFKNLKKIYGLKAFGKEFYEKYANEIKSATVNVDELKQLIEENNEVKFEKLNIAFSESETLEKEAWNYINDIQSQLTHVGLIFYDKSNFLSPENNYDKVKVLKFSGVDSLISDHLSKFKNLEEVSISGRGVCFYGHEISDHLNIKKVDFSNYYTNKQALCDQCCSSMLKSMRKTTELTWARPTIQEIRLIADHLDNLQKLDIRQPLDTHLPIFLWPQMNKLKEIRMWFDMQWHGKSSIQKFLMACPNIKKIYLYHVPQSVVKKILMAFKRNMAHLRSTKVKLILIIRFLKLRENERSNKRESTKTYDFNFADNCLDSEDSDDNYYERDPDDSSNGGDSEEDD
uniref:CSON004483 protein n=1 Tax=Culicoides sonorensis TaxID=179676 RepID=A0A336LXI1_CULSO